MKKFKLLGLLIAVVFGAAVLAGCNNSIGGHQKIGTVDMAQLVQSPAFQKLSQSLATQDKASQSQLKAAYNDLQAANAAVKKATGAAKQSATAKAKAAQAKFTNLMTAFQSTQKQQQMQLKNKLEAAISAVAKEKGLSTIYLKQVVLYGNDPDVTQDVLNKLTAK